MASFRPKTVLQSKWTLSPRYADSQQAVENIWQYLRSNWRSNCAFGTYDAIIEDLTDAVTSIGIRDWARVGQVYFGISCPAMETTPPLRKWMKEPTVEFRG
jgi:hypothetical protein